jgi:hypothetical protein
MRPINTLDDLYEAFGSEHSFASLNRRIYKSTECGASISVYGTVAATDASQADVDSALRAGARLAVDAEYARVLPSLEEAYRAASPEEKERIQSMDQAFAEGRREPLIEWARTVVPGCFPETTVTPERVPVAYHCGHQGEIPASFELTGFTIQSIVEGSDAEVCSGTLRLGLTKEEIDAWVAWVEDEVDRLWHEANGEDDGEE